MDLASNTTLGHFHSLTGDHQEEYEILDKMVAGTQEAKPTLPIEDMLTDSHLTKAQYEKTKQVLSSYADVFSSSADDIGQADVYHTAETPIRQRAYRTSPTMRLEIQRQVDDLLQRGIIEESHSPWSSPIVMVKKKDSTYRFCIDYRALNAVTIRDSHPIPRQDDSVDALSSSSFFSVMDLSSGYWQIRLDPESKEKTAFTTGSGLYQSNVMPFGLVNAPMTFQRLMEAVFHGLHWSTCLIYLDDCIVMGRSFEEHLHNLQEVLQRFKDAGLKLKPSKCQFLQKKVTYLGFVIGTQGVLPDPNNTAKVAAWPRPQNATQVRSFLGLASFYRRFIPGFAKVSTPLTNLTHKGMPFIWNADCETAFINLKMELANPPILAYPNFKNTFNLASDASNDAIGAILSQVQDERDHVIAYYSQKLTGSQKKWSTYDRELWAIVAAVRHFRHYLRGQHFTVFTDHQPLLGYKKVPIQDDATGRRARWIVELDAYSFNIIHRKGRSNQNADALSRLPHHETAPDEQIKMSQQHQTSCNVVHTRSSSKALEMPEGTRESLEQNHAPEKKGNDQSQPEKKGNGQSQPENFILADQESDLQYYQKQDKDINRVIEYVKMGQRPSVRAIRRLNHRLIQILSEFPRLTINNDILYRKNMNKLGTTTLQPVVPEYLIPKVLEELHGHPASGHFGSQRTLQRAEATCYWPFMRRDITNHCSTCAACESFRSPNSKHQAPLRSITTDHPLQMVFADIAELPISRRGYRYILVIVDHFSKYVNIYPMKNQTAQTVAKHIFEDYVQEHGVPETLHTDQGRQFESRLVQQLCEKLGIRKSRSSPYHPQGAGIVERANRVIKEQLARYIADQGGDWDSHLHQLQLAYNSSVHSTTGLTPYFILHGREARVPANITCPVPAQYATSPEQYAIDVHQRLKKACQFAQQNSQQAQRRQKAGYDKKTRVIKYNSGDLVWLHDPVNARNKLDPNWLGPFSIMSSSDDGLNYRIADIHNERTQKVVHHNRLKLFRSRLPRRHEKVTNHQLGKESRSHRDIPPSTSQPPLEPSFIEWSTTQQQGPDYTDQPSWSEQSVQQSVRTPEALTQPNSTDHPQRSEQHIQQTPEVHHQPDADLTDHQSRSGESEYQPPEVNPEPANSDYQPPSDLSTHRQRRDVDLQPDRTYQSHSDNQPAPGPPDERQTLADHPIQPPGPSSNVHHSDDTLAKAQQPTEQHVDNSVTTSRYGRNVRMPQRFRDYQK